MSSKIHIKSPSRSICHLQAKNVLVDFDAFVLVKEIIPESLCHWCLKEMELMLSDPEKLESYRRKMGLALLFSMNKT